VSGHVTSLPKSVCCTERCALAAGAGVLPLQGGAAGSPDIVHVPKLGVLHTGRVPSSLTVQRLGTAQSGIRGAVISLLIEWIVFNIKRIENYKKIKSFWITRTDSVLYLHSLLHSI